MKNIVLVGAILLLAKQAGSWGFYAHRKINHLAVYLLPPEMMVLYKPHIDWLSEHAVDPDKRRYAVEAEGPRHYIDIDYYGAWPYDSLPRTWSKAVDKYTEDTLQKYGIVPWWIQQTHKRLSEAFQQKDQARILQISADIGHYIGDAHVPLHVCSNHNGQHTGQHGIHGFWESRIPELLAEKEWNFLLGKAMYIDNPATYIWERVLQSAKAADTVLTFEQQLSERYPAQRKYAYEERNGVTIRQYSGDYAREYNRRLNNMVERRMRQSIQAVASMWYTAWVNAGQPDLTQLTHKKFTREEQEALHDLDQQWRNAKPAQRACE